MREEAQNSLLKLLEEPPDYWLFLLVADQVEWLLPTIRSRLIELRFDPLSEKETEQVLETITVPEDCRPAALADMSQDAVQERWRQQRPVLARLAGGSAGKALEWFRLDALTLRGRDAGPSGTIWPGRPAGVYQWPALVDERMTGQKAWCLWNCCCCCCGTACF